MGVQPEDQKSKAANQRALTPASDRKWVILPPRILRLKLSVRPVSSCFVFLSSAGIKGMHHHCLACMAALHRSLDKLYLLKHK